MIIQNIIRMYDYYNNQIPLFELLGESYYTKTRERFFENRGFRVVHSALVATGFSAIAALDNKNNLFIFYPGAYYSVDFINSVCLMIGRENPQMIYDVPKFLGQLFDKLTKNGITISGLSIYGHSLGVGNLIKSIQYIHANKPDGINNISAFSLEDIGSKSIANFLEIDLDIFGSFCDYYAFNFYLKNGFNSTLEHIMPPIYVKPNNNIYISKYKSVRTFLEAANGHKIKSFLENVSLITCAHEEYSNTANQNGIYKNLTSSIKHDLYSLTSKIRGQHDHQ